MEVVDIGGEEGGGVCDAATPGEEVEGVVGEEVGSCDAGGAAGGWFGGHWRRIGTSKLQRAIGDDLFSSSSRIARVDYFVGK